MKRSGILPGFARLPVSMMACVGFVVGCSTSDYDKQFDASLQQYRADAAAGRKGRAVARPVAVEGVAPAADAPPADGAAPPGVVPPGAVPPGVVPPGAVPPAAPQ